MQESLRLIQIPQVDTSRLSTVGEFRRSVERIERRYDMNLEFNDNARWRPGSYERLKGQVIKALFPQWGKDKGANTIRKLTRFHNYDLTQLANDLKQIDNDLRHFRQIKQSLDIDKAADEGLELLNEYMLYLTEPTNGVKIEITSLPYFAKNRRSNGGRNGIYEDAWDRPLHPKYDRDGELDKYTISRQQIEGLYKVYNLNRNPQRWFINIIIPLNDVSIDYYHGNESQSPLCSNLYGDMVVCFTVPLYDAILNYRIIKKWDPKITFNRQDNLVHRLHTSYITNHTYRFPYVSGIQHPYIQRSGRYSYDFGNTCFGDFKNDVIMAISTGMMGQLRAVLTKWSSTFYLGNTTPLNQTDTHHIGMPKDWVGTRIPDYMGTSIELCRTVVRNGMKQEDLLNNFCSTCALSKKNESRDICDYFLRLTKPPMEIPSTFLLELDKLIESEGLPGIHEQDTFNAKITIQEKVVEMWNFCTNQAEMDSFLMAKLWFVENMGNGNTDSHVFNDLCTAFMRNVLEYNDTDIKNIAYNSLLATDAYLIYRHCERMYWLSSINTYNEGLFLDLEETYFATVKKAEDAYPIADYRSMVNTYRLSHNQSLYTEYLDILKPNSEVELDDTLNAWLHQNDDGTTAPNPVVEAERGPTNERNPF